MKTILRKVYCIGILSLYVTMSLQAQCSDCSDSSTTLTECYATTSDAVYDLTSISAGSNPGYYNVCTGPGNLSDTISSPNAFTPSGNDTKVFVVDYNEDGTVCNGVTEVTLAVESLSFTVSVDSEPSGVGEIDGSLTIAVSNGEGDFDWNWNDGTTTDMGGPETTTSFNVGGLGDGTYDFTVTDTNGCTGAGSGTLTEPACSMAIALVGTDPTTVGGTEGTIEITVSMGDEGPTSDGYDYVINPGNIIGSFGDSGNPFTESGLGGGAYTVSVTDEDGCSDSDGVTLTAPTCTMDITLSSDPPTVIGGSDGKIYVDVINGSGTYAYNVTGDGTDSDTGITNDPFEILLPAGTYDVEVTDGTGMVCAVSKEETIVPGPCVLDISLSSTNPTSVGGNEGTIEITVINGDDGPSNNAYDFTINPGNTTGSFGESGNPFTISGFVEGNYTVSLVDETGATCEVSDIAMLTEPDCSLSITLDATDPTTFNGTEGTIEITVLNGDDGPGNDAYDFTINPGNTTGSFGDSGNPFTVEGLGADNYTVMVTDFDDCADTETIEIFPYVCNFAPTASQLSEACPGVPNGAIILEGLNSGDGPFDITINPGTTYSGVDEGDDFTLSGLDGSPGSGKKHDITVVDSKGCEVIFNDIEVTLKDALSPTISSNLVLCSDETSTTIEVDQGFYDTYAWNGGGTNQSKIVGDGTHTVTVTDQGCEGEVSVTVVTQSEIDLSLGGGSKVAIDCSGDTDGKIVVSETGGSGNYTTYEWTGPDGSYPNSNTLTGLRDGTYDLTVTDSENCIATFTQVITTPDPLIITAVVTSDATCAGFSDGEITLNIDGGEGPYTIAWSNGGSGTVINNLASDTYTVTVTDNNNCSGVESKFVSEPPAVVGVITPSSPEICIGEVVTLTASGGTDYAWEDGPGTADNDVSPSSTTTFTVTVTDANTNDCTNIVSTQVNVNSLPDPSISISENSGLANDDGNVCDGSQVTLSASGGVSAIWQAGNSNPFTFTPTVGTNSYSVTITDSNGCMQSATQEITTSENPTALINLDDATRTIQEEQSIINDSNPNCGSLVSCKWFVDNVPQEENCSSFNPTFNAIGELDIKLVVENSCGCVAERTEELRINASASCAIKSFSINNGTGIACVGQEVPIIFDNATTDGCSLPSTSPITVRRGGSVTNDYTLNASEGTIVFNKTGTYEVTDAFEDSCGCSRTRVRTVEVLGSPEISFAAGNPTIGCVGEVLNIKFAGYDQGEKVLVTGVTGNPEPFESDNFTVNLSEPGQKVLEIIRVSFGACEVGVSSQKLTINVVPPFTAVVNDTPCEDELGLFYDLILDIEGGESGKPVVVDGIKQGQVVGSQYIISGLDPTASYDFTIKRGDLCSSVPIKQDNVICLCAFDINNPTVSPIAGCEGDALDLSGAFGITGDFDAERDTLFLMLHDKPNSLGVGDVSAVYPFTKTSFRSDFPGFKPGRSYYLSVVGIRKAQLETFDFNDLGSISNLGRDECFSVVEGIPLTWFREPKPQAKTASGDTEICRNGYDVLVYVPNQQEGSNLEFLVEGNPDEYTRKYGAQDSAYIYFKDDGRDSFIVTVIETKINIDPNTELPYTCIGSSEIVFHVRDGVGAPDPAEIILWPGDILASTADPATVCHSWGSTFNGVESENQGEGKYFYAAPNTDFSGSRLFFVDTYFCDSPECSTRVYYNSAGPVPGLTYSDQDEFGYLVSPNPNTGQFKLDLFSKYPSHFNIDIYDLNGQKIFSQLKKGRQGNNVVLFDLENNVSGIYFLRIYDQTSNRQSVEKIIIN